MPYIYPFNDLSGQRFTRWLVLHRDTATKREVRFICRCDCGTVRSVRKQNLTRGESGSCGCLHHENQPQVAVAVNFKHGFTRKEPLYGVWVGMRRRCTNKNERGYHNYGGRGISVCTEWGDYLVFREWASKAGYKKGLQIDRIDNDRNYTPENCRWVTQKVNCSNKRDTLYIMIGGKREKFLDVADRYGINRQTLYSRIFIYGFTPEDAVKKPEAGRQRLRNPAKNAAHQIIDQVLQG